MFFFFFQIFPPPQQSARVPVSVGMGWEPDGRALQAVIPRGGSSENILEQIIIKVIESALEVLPKIMHVFLSRLFISSTAVEF